MVGANPGIESLTRRRGALAARQPRRDGRRDEVVLEIEHQRAVRGDVQRDLVLELRRRASIAVGACDFGVGCEGSRERRVRARLPKLLKR